MSGKSTTNALFAVRILFKNSTLEQKELHCAFVKLESAYDIAPREELLHCLRKTGVTEKYVSVIQDMYEGSRIMVNNAVGSTKWFKVKIELHQESALRLFVFAETTERLTNQIKKTS